MAKNWLRKFITVAATVVLIAASFSGIGMWRRSQDSAWCRRATASAAAVGISGGQEELDQERLACMVQRRHQRSFFGAVWRSGGPDMAACGFDYARLQLLSQQDLAGEAALLASYGFDDAKNFDTSGGSDQVRFVQACLARRHGRSG